MSTETPNFDTVWQSHAQLVRLHSQTVVLLGGATGRIDGASWAAMMGRCGQLADLIARLGPQGELGVQLKAGGFSVDKWTGLLKLCWDELVSMQREVGTTIANFDNVFGQVVWPTFTTIGKGVKDAALETKNAVESNFYPVLILVVVLVVGLVVLRVV